MTKEPAAVLGIDIGGTKTGVIAGQSNGHALSVTRRGSFATEPASRSWQEAVREICSLARQILDADGAARALAAAGVSCGGPLDSRRGLVLSPPNLPGWDRVPIVEELSRALGCPVFLQNDANAGALAEWRFGAGKGTRNMVFLTFGTGMGAGLILDGRLYEGTNDLAGEVGHIRLAEDGPVGYGKPGSFEGFCSGGGIARLAQAEIRRLLAEGHPVSFCPDEKSVESVTSREVGEAAEAGDPLARQILTESGRWLGRGLSALIDVLNPQRIVIGGIYVRCRKFLQPAMAEEISREALRGAAGVCDVVPAELGEQIGDYAALSVAVDGMSKTKEK
jgi:glucokinase